jgi:integrase/recombinase XerD
MSDEWYKTVYENKHQTINTFLQYEESVGRSPRTINAYSRVLKKFYHEHFPEATPATTGIEHVEQYLAILAKRDLSRNTKRRYVESLSSFFSYAVKRERFPKITANPAAAVLEELPRVTRDRPDCATWENAKQIIHAIPDPRNKAVTVLLAKTGCRLTEALEIRLDDLLLDQGFIRLQSRKGGDEGVIPVDEEVVKTINRFRMVRGRTESEYLFGSIHGNRVSREMVRRAVRTAAVDQGITEEKASEFNEKFTPHTFRTVFTTLMRRQGMDDRILQYIKGDSPSSTIDLYTKIDRQKVKEQYLECMKSLNF